MKLPKFPSHMLGWTRIETAVLIMTGVITAALVALVWYSISTLSSRDWCGQITVAEKVTGSQTTTDQETVRLVIQQCTTLLESQLASVGFVAKMLAGGLALCVVAMYLVKFAGGQASGEIAGNKFSVSGDKPEERALTVTTSTTATTTADTVDIVHPVIAQEEEEGK